VEVGLDRIANRTAAQDGSEAGKDRFESDTRDFHERVRGGFLALAVAEPNRFRVLDASASEAEVRRTVEGLIERELFQCPLPT
jgi:dTMP kinase